MQVKFINRKMFLVQILSFLLVLFAMGQCQRLTTTTDEPWVWGGEGPRNPNPKTTPRPQNSVPTTQSNANTTPNRKNQPTPRTCQGCPRTSQFNPVCGSDMATYQNPTAVACANMCGPKIEILFYAACQPTA